MRLTNTTSKTLGLPKANPVAPGATVEVEDSVVHNRIVAAWIGKGMLIVEGKAPPAQESEEDETTDNGMTKDQIIAELAEYGVTRDKRTSKANLTSLLEEVRAERADTKAGEDEAE